jgi:hypothetical protein
MRTSPHKGKALIIWALMRLWPRWPRLAVVLARGVQKIWPGFRRS